MSINNFSNNIINNLTINSNTNFDLGIANSSFLNAYNINPENSKDPFKSNFISE